MLKKVNTYIPLQLKEDLSLLNLKNTEIQNLCVFVNQIVWARRFADDKTKSSKRYKQGWIQLNRDILRSISRGVDNIKKTAIDLNIVECDNKYYPGLKSYGYRLNSKYFTKELFVDDNENSGLFCKVEVTIKTVLKSIQKRLDIQEKRSEEYEDLRKTLKKMTINYSKAKSKADKMFKEGLITAEAYSFYIISFKSIRDKDYFFIIDNFSGRLHNNLTNLKKEFREFIYFENDNINDKYAILDISNAQPFMLAQMFETTFIEKYNNLLNPYLSILHDNNYSDIKMFRIQANSGNLWQYLETTLKTDIKRIKKSFITLLFQDNDEYKISTTSKLILEKFPNLFKKINEIKRISGYKTLAKILQKIEVEYILNISRKALNAADITKFLTIHDSIFVNKELEFKAIEAIKNEFYNLNLKCPVFKNDFTGKKYVLQNTHKNTLEEIFYY